MDPQELALQIQMMEEYAKRNQKEKEREQRRRGTESASKASSHKRAQEEPHALGGKASGFSHGFDRLDAPQAKTEEKKRSA